MALPRVDVTIQDGALGLVSSGGTNTVALVGTCSLGTEGEVAAFGSLTALKSALGVGPLVECAAYIINTPGVSEVLCVTAPSSVAGVASAVSTMGTGTGVVTVTGTPLDAYSVRVEVLSNGTNLAAATATFRYSLDGGGTYSSTLALPTSGAYLLAETGLTLHFANGGSGVSFKAGDVHEFTTSAPYYSQAEAMAAVDALLADSTPFFKVHLVGAPSSVSNAAALAAALDSKLTAAAGAYRFLYGTIEAPEDTDSNLKSGFASFACANGQVDVAAGTATYVSPLTSRLIERSIAWADSARAAAVPPGIHLGQVSNDDGNGGPLPGVVAISRDERVTPGLDDARFTTARTHVRRPGFFLTRGRLMASPGSDFQQQQHKRVMDVAANQLALDAQEYIAKSVLVDATTGRIREGEARSIENALAGKLRAVLVQTGDASAVQVVVDRTTNLLSTGTLSITGRIIPKGYTEFISVTLGFSNPALQTA